MSTRVQPMTSFPWTFNTLTGLVIPQFVPGEKSISDLATPRIEPKARKAFILKTGEVCSWTVRYKRSGSTGHHGSKQPFFCTSTFQMLVSYLYSIGIAHNGDLEQIILIFDFVLIALRRFCMTLMRTTQPSHLERSKPTLDFSIRAQL